MNNFREHNVKQMEIKINLRKRKHKSNKILVSDGMDLE